VKDGSTMVFYGGYLAFCHGFPFAVNDAVSMGF
jgi:hypothetical protein